MTSLSQWHGNRSTKRFQERVQAHGGAYHGVQRHAVPLRTALLLRLRRAGRLQPHLRPRCARSNGRACLRTLSKAIFTWSDLSAHTTIASYVE